MSQLAAWALAALQSLPTYKEDVGSPNKQAQLAMVAETFTQAAKEAKGWQGSRQELLAAELTIAFHESGFSERIHRNECKPLECDRGRAIGLTQLHAKALSSADVWPKLGFMTFESTMLTAKETARVLVRSQGLCRAVKGDLVAMTFAAYAGRGCQLDRWQGWRARVSTYQRILRVPMPQPVAANDSQKSAG